MIRAVLRVALCLAAGASVVALLYWAFLNTPESRTLLLALSALLVIAIVTMAAITINLSLLLATASPVGRALGRSARIVPVSVAAAALVVLAATGVRRFDAWLAGHSGEVSAWFIATFDWADVTWLFEIARYASAWLRWVLFPVTALALVASVLLAGIGAVRSVAWVRAAWHWRTLLVATAAFVLLIWLPSLGASWRPARLPPAWAEPLLAGTRLLLIAVAMLLGAAVAVTAVARGVRDRAAVRNEG